MAAWSRLSDQALNQLEAKQFDSLVAERNLALKAVGPGDRIEVENAWGRFNAEASWLRSEYADERTRRLKLRALQYLIELPSTSDSEAWWDDPTWGYQLTVAGELRVRRLIREAERAKHAEWRGWATSITGLLGVVVAILALLLRSFAK